MSESNGPGKRPSFFEGNAMNREQRRRTREPRKYAPVMPLRALVVNKEEAALVRVALTALRERKEGLLTAEGLAVLRALETKAEKVFESLVEAS